MNKYEFSPVFKTTTKLAKASEPKISVIEINSEEELQAQLDIATAQYEAAKLGQTNETN